MVSLSEVSDEGIPLQSSIYLSRPTIKSAAQTDTFRFYAGPQLKGDMAIYNDASLNSFGVSGLQLEAALDSSSWLGWLETILKTLLNMLYRVIPNYGIGIIILTFLLKLVLYPITKKGMESTAKMASLSPKKCRRSRKSILIIQPNRMKRWQPCTRRRRSTNGWMSPDVVAVPHPYRLLRTT